MAYFEIFIERPVKVEVEAETFEEAVELIKQQYGIPDGTNIKFSMPVEAEEPRPPQQATSEES